MFRCFCFGVGDDELVLVLSMCIRLAAVAFVYMLFKQKIRSYFVEIIYKSEVFP